MKVIHKYGKGQLHAVRNKSLTLMCLAKKPPPPKTNMVPFTGLAACAHFALSDISLLFGLVCLDNNVKNAQPDLPPTLLKNMRERE